MLFRKHRSLAALRLRSYLQVKFLREKSLDFVEGTDKGNFLVLLSTTFFWISEKRKVISFSRKTNWSHLNYSIDNYRIERATKDRMSCDLEVVFYSKLSFAHLVEPIVPLKTRRNLRVVWWLGWDLLLMKRACKLLGRHHLEYLTVVTEDAHLMVKNIQRKLLRTSRWWFCGRLDTIYYFTMWGS